MSVLRVISHFLLRAPALPVSALGSREGEALLPAELAVAGRVLLAGSRAERSYRARAAFRPTPSGLLAGVAVGTLGETTALATGGAGQARIDVGWGRAAALARAVLDEPVGRRAARLRAAPSLLRDGDHALWLSRGGEAPVAQVERAVVDEPMAAALAATQQWARWTKVRSAVQVSTGGDDEESVDDYLLLLLDGGLLLDDLTPPLVGDPPLGGLRRRLARARSRPLRALASALDELAEGLAPVHPPDVPALIEQVDAAQERLAALPGAGVPGERTGPPLRAVLELRPDECVLSRAAVERAARVAATMFRLCAAFAPTSERATGRALEAGLRAVLEAHEPGGYPLAPLAFGRYGAPLGEAPPAALGAEFPELPLLEGAGPSTVPAPLLRALVARIAGGAREVALSVEELDALLPAGELPPTFELVLAPCREPAGEPPGTGWLLGLHGPAGATWGRFVHALPPLHDAFAALHAAEPAALDGATPLDVDYAPSAAVADVAVHPPLRRAALALSSWPDSDEAVTPADLELVVSGRLAIEDIGDSPSVLGLREARSGRAVVPLPGARLRSTTVPEEGPYRLLVGFSLQRAVAPWALHPGPLAALPRLPRFSVEGFVVAPASWAIPERLPEACRRGGDAGREAIARWRMALGVDRLVQIGHEDQLLPVDLEGEDAIEALARLRAPLPRAWEIWPPLDRLADRDGRRVEAVVAVVAPGGPPAPTGDRVDPEPDPAWRTFKLYGPPDRADRLLGTVVAPAIAGAGDARAIDAWFFQRYLDESGRHHLRLRVRAARRGPRGRRQGEAAAFARFGELLESLAAPARAAGDLWAIESGEYRPERGRFGGARAMPFVEAVFQEDSHLCLVLLRQEPRPDGMELLVRSFDALATGLGLDLAERARIATRCREQHAARLRPDEAEPDPLAPLYRERQPALLAALAADRRTRPARGGEEDFDAPVFRAHAARLATLRKRFHREVPGGTRALARAILPSLLHLAAVRLVGPGHDREAIGYYLWQRALESSIARSG